MRTISLLLFGLGAAILLIGLGVYAIQLPTNGGSATAMRSATPFFTAAVVAVVVGWLIRRFAR
jgi:hypothetical protein